MAYVIASFVIALLTAAVAMPLLIAISRRIGGLDIPLGDLVIHSDPIPRVGGLGMGFAVLASSLFMLVLSPSSEGLEGSIPTSPILPFSPAVLWPLIAGGAVAFLGGFWDDLVGQSRRRRHEGLAPPVKFFILVLAALVTIVLWVAVSGSGYTFSLLSALYSLLLLFYLLGGPNSMNLLDGMDGLAGGVGGIAGLALGILGMITGRQDVALLAFALAGASAGFLVFNKPPAKIFMGDGGAYILGFLLAGCAFSLFRGTVGSFLGPILVLGIPIADTSLAIHRRLVSRSFFKGDRAHTYDLARDRWGDRKTLLLFYAAAVILGALGVAIGVL
jgi:UDP-GlcNAc:undecaprenyl-phosphate GlcNAc-1-phosphate transferase